MFALFGLLKTCEPIQVTESWSMLRYQLRKHVLQLLDLLLRSSRSWWYNPVRFRHGSIWNQHDRYLRSVGLDGPRRWEEEAVFDGFGVFGDYLVCHGIFGIGKG